MRKALVTMMLSMLMAACAGGGRSAGAGDPAHWDAMSREHAHETPAANASAQAPAQEVATREVEYVVDGERVRGFEARPASAAVDARLPSIILVHEWWGLNDNIRMMARRLAGEGYRTFAVDMYHGRVAQNAQEARALVEEVLRDTDRGMAHLMTAAMYLEQATGADRIGIVGWCFGGGWALAGGLEMPDRIDATAMYYGRIVTDRDELAKLGGPLLGLFGGADESIPVAQVRQMEATLRELGKDVTIHVYEGAGHAFANPSGQSYRADAAEDAWRRTLTFFDEHLR
ncbi:MAG TPA: dienelactone hydrolase family protein [Longimicrobium sp.]|nr:dienelactone hydrolase family protein [Longimicrobium sp.]